MSVVVERAFHLATVNGGRGGFRRSVREGVDPPAPPAALARVPRIAKLMALAIRYEQMLRSGAVADASALARLAHVSQPRMTQILNLTLLAPDIQERLLFLQAVAEDQMGIQEKSLRRVCSAMDWVHQRVLGVKLFQQDASSGPR